MDNVFVQTCRPIQTFTIENNDAEGDSGTGVGGWVLWVIVSALWCMPMFIFVTQVIPLPVVIFITVIYEIIMLIKFPFKLKVRMKAFYEMMESSGNDVSSINKLIDVDDNGLIMWNNDLVGYMLMCNPNYYNNYNNYASDYKNFRDIFNNFTVVSKYLKNTEPVKYIKTEELGIYQDSEVLFDRLKLAGYAESKLSTESYVYNIYMLIVTNSFRLEELNKQMEEMKHSEFRRVFCSIKVAKAEDVYKVAGRDLGLTISREFLLSNKSKNVLSIDKDKNVMIN